jgi:cyclase
LYTFEPAGDDHAQQPQTGVPGRRGAGRNGDSECRVAEEISAIKDGIHVIMGRGGNIGVSVGEDGVFMIDDQFAPATEAILGQVKTVTDQPVRFLVNTHFHRDHTGGNENLGKAGVLIFAHDNVRARLLAGDAPADALPVVTFNDTTTFHMNGQTVRVFHTANAHTDGDAMIHFQEADVIHMGDTFFNGFYPFIDSRSGGSIEGVFRSIDLVLELADAETVIIPGHGPIADRDDLIAYRDMLTKARDAISPLMASPWRRSSPRHRRRNLTPRGAEDSSIPSASTG